MLMDFVIIGVFTENENKWQNYTRQKNELFGAFAVEVDELIKDEFIEHRDEYADDVVGLITIDLSLEKLLETGYIKKKDYDRLVKK